MAERTTRAPREATPSSPDIDFLIVADRAEAVNGKLYMMGGAWDRLFVRDFEEPVGFSIAVSVVVPWTATNELHELTLSVETADGVKLEPQMGVGINVGRPPTAEAGQSFRALVAADVRYKLPGPGAYVVVAALAGSDTRRTVFYATPPPAVPMLLTG
jgi:hypothetical protein